MPRTLVLLTVVAGLAAAGSAVAADPAPPAPGVTANGAVTALHAFPSDLDGGGRVEWSGVTFSGGVKRQFMPAFSAGLSIAHDRQQWDFSSAGGFGGVAPWGPLQRTGVGLNLNLALSPSVLVGLSTSAEWAAAAGVSGNDALTYGVTVSALRVFSPKRVLGGGAKVARQFYGVKTSPFVIVHWQLTDRLRIANSIPAGPEGGAGVELRYAPDPRWEFAGGAVVRSDRYRLPGGGPTGADIAEPGGMPLLARISRTFDARTRIDFYAGALVNGSLKVKDGDGHELVKDGCAPAPTIALTLSRKF
jgi:hypothetical protein